MMDVDSELSACPFPGLRPFDSSESHLFFGRDGQSDQLIERLKRTRFLTVVGTSGSGKSSLIWAGLLPALHAGFMPGAGSLWRVAIMHPGSNPVGSLASALTEREVLNIARNEDQSVRLAIVDAALRRGRRGLVEIAKQSLMQTQTHENLLIVVDEFETLFRFQAISLGGSSQEEAADFVKLLLEASRQSEIPIYVVLVLRSDYIGDCSVFWGLPEAINNGLFSIPRMNRDQLRAAVTGPVAVAWANITPRLVNRLLNDVGDNQDQLPVFQHLLMRSWHEWKEKRLVVELPNGEGRPHREVHQGDAIDSCCAEAVGGMAEALSRHADEAYFELPDDSHREVAANLFKALIEKGTDNREIPRPITLGALTSITGARQSEVITVIEAFRQPGRAFLMPPAPIALNSESLVDISHESLIRGWPPLKEWVDEEARSARIYRRLAETAVLYTEDRAGLWRDPDLQIALTWRGQTRPNEAWARRYHPEFNAAMEFLDQSVKARDAEVFSSEQRQLLDVKSQVLDIKRSRRISVLMFILFLLALGAFILAYTKSI